MISDRYAGFSGARMLRDGDVVLSIYERPDQPIVNNRALQDAVQGFVVGETIHLQLLRQGQVIRVPVTLAPRPDAAVTVDIETMRRFDRQREERAEQYWEQAFAPLLKEGSG
jgi:hypothetical protein